MFHESGRDPFQRKLPKLAAAQRNTEELPTTTERSHGDCDHGKRRLCMLCCCVRIVVHVPAGALKPDPTAAICLPFASVYDSSSRVVPGLIDLKRVDPNETQLV